MDDDDNNNNIRKKTESPSPPLTDLIQSLEQATLMAKQLPSTTDPNYLLHIYCFLHRAHHNLSSFLSNTHFPAPENSLSSATGAAADANGGDPMQVGDDDDDDADDDEEENSKTSVDKVEERMRDCFIKNKRPKRPLSPSSMAVVEEKRLFEDGFVGGSNGFDPHGTRLRALDLVYQFHG